MSNQDLNLIIMGFTVLILLVTAIIYWIGTNQAIRKSTREATHEIYKEWWGDELHSLRKYFYVKFLPIYLPKYRQALIGKGMKEIDKIIKEDEGKIRRLCYFFDRVGWLGAADLIDIDYVLGPMQYSLRRVWIVMEPFIKIERKYKSDHFFDPVYQFGFEWMFKRSNKKHLAKLTRKKFKNPKLLSRNQSNTMQSQIDNDEAIFREILSKVEFFTSDIRAKNN